LLVVAPTTQIGTPVAFLDIPLAFVEAVTVEIVFEDELPFNRLDVENTTGRIVVNATAGRQAKQRHETGEQEAWTDQPRRFALGIGTASVT
jgi:hypothetical protein